MPIRVNLAQFDAPRQRLLPAGVYEIVREGEAAPRLQINSQNCLHCKPATSGPDAKHCLDHAGRWGGPN